MNFCMVGIDHRHTPLAVRERFFLSRIQAETLAARIMAQGQAEGVFILSTCARTEIYAQGSSEKELKTALFPSVKEVDGTMQFRSGRAAVAHLFAVAAGVDSPIFGDADVVRQIKDAYVLAREQGTLTTPLSRVLERALCVSRDIRSALHLTQRDGNVAALAVQRAIKNYGDLAGHVIYVIGCGVVGQALTAELSQHKAQIRIVANRSQDRAALVAKEHGCQAIRFEDFYTGIPEADMIFSATSSPHAVVSAELFERAIPAGKRIVIFDLAVPRDIDGKIADFPGVTLYTVDDIGAPGTAVLVAQAWRIAQRKAEELFIREKTYAG